MNAIFTQQPKFCPRCRKRVLYAFEAAYLATVEEDLRRWHAGESVKCHNCGAEFMRVEEIKISYAHDRLDKERIQ